MGLVHGMLIFVGWLAAVAGTGGALALGFALVCRWLEWAPVNTTVNVYDTRNRDDGEGTKP